MMFQAVPIGLKDLIKAAYIAAFLCLLISSGLNQSQVLGVPLGVPPV
jgi:hypothetical protein